MNVQFAKKKFSATAKFQVMPSLRPSIIHFHKTLLMLLSCSLLADHATGILDNSNYGRLPSSFRLGRFGLNEVAHLRSLRSALGMENIGHVESFTYPLASRSAAMISGRGFRPGKRYDTGIISFM
uniref:SCP domain-containing protein n=1 Tax=Elaeophora elaphi TaxID=1147741 RepID=A0A0R3RI95_9BILA